MVASDTGFCFEQFYNHQLKSMDKGLSIHFDEAWKSYGIASQMAI